jgi:1,4-alpha-glucan branching enzyme
VNERLGDLAIVLHSHMPYVEGFGTYPFGEEWLFDAVIRSHVPVLDVADRLTVTVTPVLADQLEAPGVAERLDSFLREYRIGSCTADAGDVEPELREACLAEARRYERVRDRLGELGYDLLEVFRAPAREGRVELVASAASHAVLPLVATAEVRGLQLDAGLRSHRRRFGEPAGFWLPECAYEGGIEELLARAGIDFFFSDQSAHEEPLAALVPVATAAGPVALTLDWEAVSWLWSHDGYPSEPAHADFHRKTWRGTRAWGIGGEAYDPDRAAEVARRQAREFAAAAAARLRAFRESRGRPGLITFAIDTELLGHWWSEGPQWLAEVIRVAPEHGIELVTASEALDRHQPEERPLHPSTWGDGKDLRTWDSPPVADMAWAARRLELRFLRALGDGLPEAAMARGARELLALQASDWAFLDMRKQAGDYPWKRSTDHAYGLLDAIDCGRAEPPEPRLRNLAPDLSLTRLLASTR